MVHAWSKHTDGNGATVRAVLFDFRKAFDLIDHGILAKKLENWELSPGIVSWVIDFPKNQKQRGACMEYRKEQNSDRNFRGLFEALVYKSMEA